MNILSPNSIEHTEPLQSRSTMWRGERRRLAEIEQLYEESRQDDESLEIPSDDGFSIHGIWSETDVLGRIDAERIIANRLLRVSPREERAVRLAFGLSALGETPVEDIATELGIGRQRTYKIIEGALRKMRYPKKKLVGTQEEKLNHLFVQQLRALSGLPSLEKPDWIVREEREEARKQRAQKLEREIRAVVLRNRMTREWAQRQTASVNRQYGEPKVKTPLNRSVGATILSVLKTVATGKFWGGKRC